MRRYIQTLMVLVVLLALPLALSAASGAPLADAWVEKAFPDRPNSGTNLDNLWVRASTTSCTPDRVSYLKWDLTDIPVGTVLQSASLTLYANGLDGDFTTPRNLTLYQLLNDNWNDSVTWNLLPPGDTPGANLGPSIQTVAVSAVGTVTFNNAGLLSYVQAEADGDNVASFALEMTDNCTAGTTGVRFDSSNKVGGNAPHLQLNSEPNSVTLTDSSAQQTNSLPLYVGLGALALVAAIGVGVSRRRTAAR